MIRSAVLALLVTFWPLALFVANGQPPFPVPKLTVTTVTNVATPIVYAGGMEKLITYTVVKRHLIEYTEGGTNYTMTKDVVIREEPQRFIFTTDKWERVPLATTESPPMPPNPLRQNR